MDKLMNDIINEAKTLEAEATLSKEDAQTLHETMGKDTNTSLDEKTKDLINKNEMLDKTQLRSRKGREGGENMKGEKWKGKVMLERWSVMMGHTSQASTS